jgi:hypothetical protein
MSALHKPHNPPTLPPSSIAQKEGLYTASESTGQTSLGAQDSISDVLWSHAPPFCSPESCQVQLRVYGVEVWCELTGIWWYITQKDNKCYPWVTLNNSNITLITNGIETYIFSVLIVTSSLNHGSHWKFFKGKWFYLNAFLVFVKMLPAEC